MAGNVFSGIMGLIGGFAQARALRQNANRVAPYVTAGTGAVGQQAASLGIGGDPAAQQQAFQNYLGSTGFQHQLKTGQDAITGSAAARGLLNSGATARALTQYGQQLGQQSFQNYFNNLGSVAQQGLTGFAASQPGLTDAAGSAASGFGAFGTGVGAGITNYLGSAAGAARFPRLAAFQGG